MRKRMEEASVTWTIPVERQQVSQLIEMLDVLSGPAFARIKVPCLVCLEHDTRCFGGGRRPVVALNVGPEQISPILFCDRVSTYFQIGLRGPQPSSSQGSYGGHGGEICQVHQVPALAVRIPPNMSTFKHNAKENACTLASGREGGGTVS